MTTIISEQAINYLNAGLSVIPVSMPTKRPNKPWKQYQTELMPLDELRIELSNMPIGTEGIAIVCGAISQNLEILDFDNKLLKLAQKTFNDFFNITEVKTIINKYDLPIEGTISGGYHLFYRCDVIEGNVKLAKATRDGKTETIIETRGEGGYVVCYPTEAYILKKGDLNKIAKITVEERNTLFNAARSFSDQSLSEWKEVKRYEKHPSTISSDMIKDVLHQNNWILTYVAGNNENYCRPGKKSGVSASYNGEVFYVFSSNAPPFEPDKGYNNFQVYALLNFDGDYLKAQSDLLARGLISEEDIKFKDDFFIYYNEARERWTIDYFKFLRFMNDYKIFRFDRESDFIFVQVTNNKIVKRIYLPEIIDFCKKYVKESKRDDMEISAIIQQLYKNENSLFNEKKLTFLNKFDGEFNFDIENTAYLYYSDAFVKITKDGIDTLDYDKLDGFIWDSQIIKRKIKGFDPSLGDEKGDFERFLEKITQFDEDNPEVNARYYALVSSIGYILHKFKNAALTKAVILCDEGDDNASDADASQGGTGKSLICNAISKIRNTAYFDGKSFDFKRSFLWQSVNEDTEVIWIDDATKWFKFENLFSYITHDFSVEQKNKKSFTIPFERAPKFIIPTNFTIMDDDVSSKRRMQEIELAPIYDENHTPIDDFGKRFFDGWDDNEWFKFDNCMANTVYVYLKKSLLTYPKINLQKRKLLQSIPEEFLDWIEPYLSNIVPDHEGVRRTTFGQIYIDFFATFTFSKWDKTQSKVTRMTKKYLDYEKIYYFITRIDKARGFAFRLDEEGTEI